MRIARYPERAVLLFVAWLGLAPAPTQPEVRWQAPEGCPSAAAFSDRVDQLRGEDRLTSSFDFVIEGDAPFVLQVAGHDERYEAMHCEALVETALLLVSLALSPAPPEPEPEPAAEPDRAEEASDVAPFLRASPIRPLSPPIEATPARLVVEAGLTAIITPRPALDLFVGAGPRGRLWTVDLGVLARPRFSGEVLEQGVGARMSTWGGLARACVGGRARRFALFGCAGLEVALASARATGPIENSQIGRRPWVAVEFGPELSVPVAERAAIMLRVSGAWLAARPQFAIAEAGSVCCDDALGISSRLGVEFGLGR